MTHRPGRIRPLAHALLLTLAACGGLAPPPPEPPRAVLPSPLPLRMVTGATPTLADAPRRIGTGEAALAGAATTVLGPIAGAAYAGVGCLAGTMGVDAGLIALLICTPIGAVLGGVEGISSAANRLEQAGYSEAEVQAMTAAVLRRMSPQRLSECLGDTLISRAAGRFVMAAPGDPVAIEAGITSLALAPPPDARQDILGQTPFLFSLAVRSVLREPQPAPGAPAPAARRVPGRQEEWKSEQQGWFRWAANDAALLEAEIGLAVGVLAQRLLADTFPDAVQPPPSGRPEALRATCRPPPPAEGVTPPAAAP